MLIAIIGQLVLFAQAPPPTPFPHYKKLTAGKTGNINPFSPDPIFAYRWKHPRASDDLETYELRPTAYVSDRPASFDMRRFRKDNVIAVNGTGSIRFDFGRVSAGWLEFDAQEMPDSVQMSISEYNEPAIVNTGAVNPVKTLAPVRHGKTYRLELNPELYEGVRFGWIHIITHRRTWSLTRLRLVCQTKPVNYQGSFACDDTLLNRIWYTGAYTVKLNLLKDYLGAILMERSDRQSWTGDAYPSQAASLVAFGNYDMVRKNLTHTAHLDNGIASYSLYWVLSLMDYVYYSGDIAFADTMFDNACQKLNIACQKFDHPTGLGYYGWDERLGAGFEHADNPETAAAYRMLAIRCWREFARFATILGRQKINGEPADTPPRLQAIQQTAAKYAGYADNKMQALRSEPHWVERVGLHAAADAVNTCLTYKREDSILYTRVFTSRVNRLSYSPFNEYFILQALAGMRRWDDALDVIQDYWGGQLQYGGTSFFEVYRPSWNDILAKNDAPINNQCGYTSLTHPWGAGVTQWLSAEILGIRPLSPGFTTFEIAPQTGSRLHWMKGTVPTPHGPIRLDYNIDSGTLRLNIPPGTSAKSLLLPLVGPVDRVYRDGKAIRIEDDKRSAITDSTLRLPEIGPGQHQFRITYRKDPKKPGISADPRGPQDTKPSEWDYAINSFIQDSTTHGSWRNTYGKDGYTLFDYDAKGQNLQRLPDYVDSLHWRGPAHVSLEAPADQTGVLTDTSDRVLRIGAFVTQDPIACLQTMTIDVTMKDTSTHRLALYFLDWDRKDRRSAVEIFDLKTLNLLAPVQMIRNYEKGKYLVFSCKGSVRLRIDQVRGVNAAVSGLFFD